MVAASVNRVSLGVQSFIDKEAASSGRLHTRAVVLRDIERLREAGITNINLDLLAGLAGQTIASWRESLAVLLETRVPHASVYMLEIDEDSRLGRELLSGGARYHADLVPSDDAIATMYEETLAAFAAGGLAQYEISNFARPGFASRHNLRYWHRQPYLGLGLDASSMLRSSDGTVLRATTTSDLGAFLNGTTAPETAWLGITQQLEEAWFLGLRLNAGVEIAALRSEFGRDAVEPGVQVAHRLSQDSLLKFEGRQTSGRFRLTDRGRLLSNEVFAEFLGLGAPEHADHREDLISVL
jgi:oxygen-independent coproporphyrinogen-3 oxidase